MAHRDLFHERVAMQRAMAMAAPVIDQMAQDTISPEEGRELMCEAWAAAAKAVTETYPNASAEAGKDLTRHLMPLALQLTEVEHEARIVRLRHALVLAGETATTVWPASHADEFPFTADHGLIAGLAGAALRLEAAVAQDSLGMPPQVLIALLLDESIRAAVVLSRRLLEDGRRKDLVSLAQTLLHRTSAMVEVAWRDEVSMASGMPSEDHGGEAMARLRLTVETRLESIALAVASAGATIRALLSTSPSAEDHDSTGTDDPA